MPSLFLAFSLFGRYAPGPSARPRVWRCCLGVRPAIVLLGVLCGPLPALAEKPELLVGSKRFTESYVLGEIIRQQAERANEARAIHKAGLGNTAIVFEALRSGAIDLYVDYTGTLAREILRMKAPAPLARLDRELAPYGLGVGVPLGFENTYALAVRREQADALGLTAISDLSRHPQLVFGLSQEFMGRQDGWPGIRDAYGLTRANVRGIDHGLAYAAAAAGQIDVTDVYTTDAKIARYRLQLLKDDRRFFPGYHAVLVFRRDLPQRLPRTWAELQKLEHSIDAGTMQRLNARVELDGLTFAAAADEFLHATASAQTTTRPEPLARRSLMSAVFAPDLPRLLGEHTAMVFGSLVLSALVGIPLGILCQRRKRWSLPVLGVAGVIQTIPALAMLALLIAATGRIGALPAVTALFLYGLLPIVRNTYTGLGDVSPGQREAATALGLRPAQTLALIEMPLARPTILAGVRTSAVINVGTATIAAFVGAGGLGERIVAGLALNDHTLLLAGALPAAALALGVEVVFAAVERKTRWRP